MSQRSFFEELASHPISWQGSRDAAVVRLKQFLPRAGRVYSSSRNYDFGSNNRSNISCLSPWLRHRLLLEEEVVRETLAHHSLESAEKFIQEVFWRAYFKGWLEQRPGVWSQYRSDVVTLLDQLENSSDLRRRYETATAGKTGIDCFDAWISELIETGYLHNHARMWFASIWIFTLRLPWQLGADFFYRHLLDGDAASNTLSWRWVAGLHTKGKHYVARQSNIEKFTDGRFSPSGLAVDPLPQIEDEEFPLQPIADSVSLTTAGPFGLLVTEEDCSPETLPLPGSPVAICGLIATHARSSLDIGKPAQLFAEQALSDALTRAETRFGVPALLSTNKDWEALLLDWASEQRVSTLITAYAPVGPIREKLDLVRHTLQRAGISLVMVRRDYDSVCWPHATRGFFKLKKKIPQLVRELGLG